MPFTACVVPYRDFLETVRFQVIGFSVVKGSICEPFVADNSKNTEDLLQAQRYVGEIMVEDEDILDLRVVVVGGKNEVFTSWPLESSVEMLGRMARSGNLCKSACKPNMSI